jgi:PAS domain S-box-containing protein
MDPISTLPIDPHDVVTASGDFLNVLPAPAYTCDESGLITAFNEGAAELWGRRPKLNDPADRYCGSHEMFAADHTPLERDRCRLALALRGERAEQAEEILIGRPDGSLVNVLAYASPIYVNKKLAGAIGILVEIAATRGLHAASRRLAAIVDSSSDAIVSKDLQGTVLTWNHAAEVMFGYAASEIVGKSITLIIPEERADEEFQVLSSIRRGETVDHFETVRQRKDGSFLDISLTVSPIRDETGRVIGASKIARDISERKRLDALLRDSDRRKEEFLALLSHELRNPLAPIRNALELARDSRKDSSTLELAHEVIDRQLSHLIRLVDDLMDASRLTRNELQLRRERVDLASAIRTAIESTRSLMESAHHELSIELPGAPVEVNGDPVRLAQVFSNLLSNAAKYTDPGGAISIALAREGTYGVVRVSDNGIGIPEDMLESIFDMFTQVDRSLERSRSGLGIGLSLVRTLVELHGGSVSASSRGTGAGSEFSVRLPAFARSGADKPGADHDSTRTRAESGCRVLVVDDNVDSAETMAMTLKLRGHTVCTAYDGLEAVDLAISFRPQIALIDIGLPRLNGYEVARRLREHPCGRGLFLSAMTGWGQEEDKARAREAGFDHHMVKPVDHAQLKALLARLEIERRALQ